MKFVLPGSFKYLMGTKSTPGDGQAGPEYPNRPPEVDTLRTLLYASMLAVCCLCFFKFSNKRRKPPTATEPRPPPLVGHPMAKRPNGDLLCQIDGTRGKISSLVFLADGKRVICACKAEKAIQMWNIEYDSSERQPWATHLGVTVNVISSSKDGELVVTGDVDGNVVVWDSILQKICETAERHGRAITALDVLSSHRIASGSNDGTVVVWEMGPPGSPLLPVSTFKMESRGASVSAVTFSPTGNHIASVCGDWGCCVKVWHIRTKHLIASIPSPGNPTRSLAWSNNGRRLFAGCDNGSVSCFDTVAGKSGFSKIIKPRPGDDSITSLFVSNSDQFLVSFSTWGRTVDIWDIWDTSACKPLHSFSRCVSASVSLDNVFLARSGVDSKISIQSVSGVVGASYFFHRVAPRLTHSEPFTYISPAAHRAWKSGELEEVERILSREIEDKQYNGFNYYGRANRALVRVRLGNLKDALDDVRTIMANSPLVPPIAHVANAMALMRLGNRREAVDALEPARHGDAKNFVDYVKSVILFESEDEIHCGSELTEPPPLTDDNSCPWVETHKILRLAERCLQKREYSKGLQFLEKAPDLRPLLHVPEAKTISLIFGWDIYDLAYMVQQLRCQALFASGYTPEVTDFLDADEYRIDEEEDVRKADLSWFCEKLGDQAMRHGKHDLAIVWYSVSLGLCPESRVMDSGSEFAKKCLSTIEAASDTIDEAITKDLALMTRYPPGPTRLLVKRSKARALRELWDDALKDADQAIRTDKLCSWGYERRYVALHALHRYQEATKALGEMITKMKKSGDESICQLGTEYVPLAETIKKIKEQFDVICDKSPLILIYVKTGHVKTGYLCDAAERIQIFKSDPIFYELVSSMSKALDTERIEKVVARYFRYVMFSHTWQGKEPTFQDVAGKSVYELDARPLEIKLRRFCETARDDPEGYLWAWSDTCCINKEVLTDYRKSIRSMYDWYKESALTIVLLAADSADLKHNRWMKRAWTLQELLSPKSIRFYDSNWKLYQRDMLHNHKESPGIKQELAEAIDLTPDALVDFSPESLSIRAKLRLASTREATEKADVAYALIGIFHSDLIPDPRKPENALGLLLEEIVHRERDAKAVLDWVGKSSEFNSCLPAHISVYQRPPYTPPHIPEDAMETRVAQLRDLLPQRNVTMFFENLSSLGSIDFTRRRLSLPCITFPVAVDATTYDGASSASTHTIVYRARAAVVGQFEFKASCTAFSPRREVILVYPWIRDLLARVDRREWVNYTRALRLVVYLEQPFRALLLAKQSVDTWKRVAADSEIFIRERKVASLEGISARTLEIR